MPVAGARGGARAGVAAKAEVGAIEEAEAGRAEAEVGMVVAGAAGGAAARVGAGVVAA